jgi:hypothetical protein
MTAPTIAQLRNLADRARKGLTDTEAARLLEGIARLADYENRITWHTTCGSCARILDSAYAETVRAEQAEAALARIAALADQHPAGIDTALIHEALDTGRQHASDTLTRIRDYLDSVDGPCCETVRRALRGIIDGPAATQATDGGTFPTHHDGPTVRECAEADRRWWGSEKVGE